MFALRSTSRSLYARLASRQVASSQFLGVSANKCEAKLSSSVQPSNKHDDGQISDLIKSALFSFENMLYGKIASWNDQAINILDEASTMLVPQLAPINAAFNSPILAMSGKVDDYQEINLRKYDIRSPDGNPNNDAYERAFQAAVVIVSIYIFWKIASRGTD